MPSSAKELGERIKSLRKRHFGRGGKSAFAAQLDLALDQYERFERGVIPPGQVLVRICEVTGEDLQWLLTGVASRGTMVISGARDRHQDLIAKVARLLESTPDAAAQLSAFVDLLCDSHRVAAAVSRPELPLPRPKHLVPILSDDDLPSRIERGPDNDERPAWLVATDVAGDPLTRCPALLSEPDARSADTAQRELHILRITDDAGVPREFVESEFVAGYFPDMFGVRIRDDALSPMLDAGDVALIATSLGPQVGRPAVYRTRDRVGVGCGVWLESCEQSVTLGRLSDGSEQTLDAADLLWSLELLYRVRLAA